LPHRASFALHDISPFASFNRCESTDFDSEPRPKGILIVRRCRDAAANRLRRPEEDSPFVENEEDAQHHARETCGVVPFKFLARIVQTCLAEAVRFAHPR
jgi:hypothetical protein